VSTTSRPPKPVPEPDEASREFWAALKEHRFTVQRCADCGFYLYPPDLMCPRCGSRDLPFVPVSGRATLYSYGIVRQPFHVSWVDDVPYVVAYVELEEQRDLRVITTLVGLEPEDVVIGMPLRVVFEDRGDHTVALFAPAKEVAA
jgi:uncharacterized protein